jgi:hypothetical protein
VLRQQQQCSRNAESTAEDAAGLSRAHHVTAADQRPQRPGEATEEFGEFLQQRLGLCRIAKREHQQPHAQQQQSAARRTYSELEGESRERRGRQVGSSSDASQGEEEPQSVGTEVR